MKKRSKSGLPPRRSSLMFVAAILVGSAALRLTASGDALLAFASEPGEVMAPKPEMSESSHSLDADVDEIVALLAELKARKETLDQREARLEERLAAVALAETEIARNLVALEEAEQSLRATMTLASSAAEDDLARLTTVYENMKPKEAAILFEEMAPEFAAGFLVRMRPDSAAAILAGLEASTAYSVSVIMAGRNANAPTQ